MLKPEGNVLKSRISFLLALALVAFICIVYTYYLSRYVRVPEEGQVDYASEYTIEDSGWVVEPLDLNKAVNLPEFREDNWPEGGKMVRLQRRLTEAVEIPTLEITTYSPYIEVYLGDTLLCVSASAPHLELFAPSADAESVGLDSDWHLNLQSIYVTLPDGYAQHDLSVVLSVPSWVEDYVHDMYGPLLSVKLADYDMLFFTPLAYELRIFLITVAMFLVCVFCLVLFLI